MPKRKRTETEACVASADTDQEDEQQVEVQEEDEQQVSLDQLPEDVLLEVMQYLGIKDLLACRLVCRRLGGLAMQPVVWKRRRLARDGKYSVLRLAPRLAFVYVRPLWLNESNSDLLSTTSCAIEELYFYLHDTGYGEFIALLVSLQASLARLRRITLSFKCLGTDDAAALLPTIASAAGLEHLNVRFWGNVPFVHYSCPLVVNMPSSIKSFQFEYVTGLDPFFESVMSTHAATLETVHLIDRTPPASIVDQLSELPHLREVSFPLPCLLSELLAARLAASDTLEVLTLQIGKSENEQETKWSTAAGVQLLFKAPHLRKVSFECKVCFNAITIELIRALASGKSSSGIESLSFKYTCEGQDGMVQALLQALPFLPALRELRMDIKDLENFASCDALLRGISPVTAPSLRDLWVIGLPCTHFMAHNDAVKAVLTANPALHLRVANRTCRCYNCFCQTCLCFDLGHYFMEEPGYDKNGRRRRVVSDKSRYICLVHAELSPKHSQNCVVVKVE